jgi:hypothetical protein
MPKLRTTVSIEEAAELKRLYAERSAAVARSNHILQAFGMESPEFFDADRAAGKLWVRIRAIQGLAGEHWMA